MLVVVCVCIYRLMIGSVLRAECRETKKFDDLMKDGYENLLARRTLNRVK